MWGATLPLGILAAFALLFRLPTKLQDKRQQVLVEYTLHFLLIIPFISLMGRFVSADISYYYVWQNGGSELPLRYRIAAVWAAREGPLLLWAAWLAIIAWLWRKPFAGEGVNQHGTRQVLMHGMTLTLLLIAWGMDPFRRTEFPEWASPGLNALLQTDLMVIHPPLIFLFYSLCLAVGAMALSTILHSEEGMEGIDVRLLSGARPAALFGVLSIGLGGLWAYTVLDWGGYWAWDPVETGSLLPWLAVVVLLHLPLKPGKVSEGIWLGVGLLTAALAIFATLVTRASGVWASSVHTFVTNADGTPASTAWGRLMDLRSDPSAGVEVMTYVLILMLMLSVWIAWMLCNNFGAKMTPKIWRTLIIIPAIALLGALYADPVQENALWEGIPASVVILLGLLPLIWTLYHLWSGWGGRVMMDPLGAPMMLGAVILAWWSGDEIVGLASILLMLLLVTRRKLTDETGLIAAGLLLHLFAAWAQLVDLLQAGTGMALFLMPIFLEVPAEQEKGPSLSSKKGQMRLVYSAPSVLVASFLFLSWMLLLNSLDRTQLQAHEFYGAPIITALATALLVYAWRERVQPEQVPYLIAALLAVTAVLAWRWGDVLPGDVDELFVGPLSRGQLAWVMLPALLLSAPALMHEVYRRLQNWLKARNERVQAGGDESRKRDKERRKISALGAQLVHLGLILLMIGHIFSTTLVERGNLDHRLSLPRDEVVVEGDYALVFTELQVLSADTEEFDSRFDVGEGFVGAAIEVYLVDESEQDGLGERIATLEPGVLRFSNGFSRSEVAMISSSTGNFILIFDLTQADELGQAMAFGELDEVERVRVTAYDLPASHLVWLGWGLMLLGMCLTWQAWWPIRMKASAS